MGDLLHQAARKGNMEELERLLTEEKMDPNGFSDSGLSPLHVAATSSFLPVVELLLEKGATLDLQAEKESVYDGYTPLHFAAERPSSAPLLSLLLQKGASDLIQDAMGRFPLHVACLKGNKAAVEILVSQGNAPRFLNAQDVHGRTPLMLACSQGHAGVVERLLKEKGKGEGEGEGEGEGIKINKVDQDGNSGLHHCFQVQSQQLFNYNYPLLDGHYQAAFEMVKAGAILDCLNHDGDAPLDVIHDSLAQLLEVVGKERLKLQDVSSIEALLGLEEEELEGRGIGGEVGAMLLNAIGAYSKVMERELALRRSRGSCPFIDSSVLPDIRKFKGATPPPPPPPSSSFFPSPSSSSSPSSAPFPAVCPLGFVGEMPRDHVALKAHHLSSPSPAPSPFLPFSFPFSRSSLSSLWLPLSVSLLAGFVAFAVQRYLK